jgi:intein/homing endonuclease
LKCHNVSSVIDLTFTNDNVITTTFEHPFFVKSKGWVEAKNLIIGDVCITDNNGESTIVDVKHYEKECEVYNLLSVSNNHNFFANKILVHNK